MTNIIDIAIIVILGASLAFGLYRGFVQTILSVACCLISVVLAFSFGPKLAAIVSGSEGISSTLATYTDAVARVGDYNLASLSVDQLPVDRIDQILSSVSLPEPIANILSSNLKNKVFADAGLTTVNDYVSNTVVGVAVNILCFIAVYAVSYLVLSVIAGLINAVFKLPLLKHLDWLAGGVFGLIRGGLILYVIFLIIPILSTVIPLDAFNELMNQSTLAPIFQSDGFFARVISGKLL
ncbi:MAG: CvpA family protein [Clostridia bacterium]|nr:CvpA family protein [Clostridia bacterium]